MTGPDLRAALHDLSEEVRTPDLLHRALTTSRRIRRRRVALTTTGTAAVLAVIVVGTGMVRSPDPAVAPPATGSSTPPATAGSTAPPTSGAPVPPPPAVSLAGTIYYLQYDPATTGMILYSRTGDDPPRLVQDGLPPSRPALSPDGRRLAWTDQGRLMVSDVDGGNERLVDRAQDAGGLCNHPAWAPDSKRVVFQPNEGLDSPWATIDVDSGRRTELDVTGVCYPTWSPDGATIGWNAPASGLVLTDADGANRREIPPIDSVDRPCKGAVYAVSPGGGRALVSNPSNPACGDGAGSWTPDGALVDTATGRPLPLPVDGPLTTGVFLPDGSLIARVAATNELVLLGPDLEIVDRAPVPSDETFALLGYLPPG